MTPFFALVRKDLILFFSDRRALLVSLMLPIVIGTFFGYLFGGSGKSEVGRTEVALVQQDSGPVAAKIAAGLKADATLTVTELDVEAARQQHPRFGVGEFRDERDCERRRVDTGERGRKFVLRRLARLAGGPLGGISQRSESLALRSPALCLDCHRSCDDGPPRQGPVEGLPRQVVSNV